MSPAVRLFDGARILPALEARRVRLRALTEADVPALFDVFGDVEVCRYWSRPAVAGLPDARALLGEIESGFEKRSLLQWGIAIRENDAVVGTCTLTSIAIEHRRAELGFALGRPHWGRGLMAEALARLLGCAFDELGLHRLEADADPRNTRSIRVLERLGFRREGLLRERYILDGEVQDAVVFGLLRSEWLGAIGLPSPAHSRASPDGSGGPHGPPA
jgi:RimJ/RimL family protein N-acetyltransferase